MKLNLFVSTILLVSCLNARVFEQTSIMEQFSSERKSEGKYDQCIEEIVGALAEIAVIAKDITAQNWVEMVEKIAELGKEIYDIVECFENTLPKNFGELQSDLVDFAVKMMSLKGDTLQCYIDHGKEAFGEFKTLLNDLSKFDTDAMQKDLDAIQATLEDAVQNC